MSSGEVVLAGIISVCLTVIICFAMAVWVTKNSNWKE